MRKEVNMIQGDVPSSDDATPSSARATRATTGSATAKARGPSPTTKTPGASASDAQALGARANGARGVDQRTKAAKANDTKANGDQANHATERATVDAAGRARGGVAQSGDAPTGDQSGAAARRPRARKPAPQRADAPPPTLRARLAALYATVALTSPTAPTIATEPARGAPTPSALVAPARVPSGRLSATPTQPAPVMALPGEDAIAATYAATVGAPLSPAKRAMLAASLHGFDAHAAARRLTLPQLTSITGGVAPSAIMATSANTVDTQAHGSSDTADADDGSGGLTVARLDAMTDETWQAFAQWLLEREGYTVERLTSAAAAPVWRGERRGAGRVGGAAAGHVDDEGEEDDAGEEASAVVIASAVRLSAGWPLEDEAVRRAASTALSEAGAQATLITTAPATVGALLEARRLGVRLLDRAALGERLRGLATAYQREQAQAQRQNQARAVAASAARERLLAALSAVEVAFVGSGRLAAQAVSGRAAVKRAAMEAREAQRLASQALLAWETLLGEWTSSFGERPARDGSLPLLADPDALDELATRGDHLRDALLTAIQKLVTTPIDGELGYGAWRQALGEDLLARIQTLRWRVQATDPDAWQDYAAARDDDALLEATAATNAGAHAAARAQQAYAQLAARVGL